MRSCATLPPLMRYAIPLRYSYWRSGERRSSSWNASSDIAPPLLGQFHDDSLDTGSVAIEIPTLSLASHPLLTIHPLIPKDKSQSMAIALARGDAGTNPSGL